MIGAGEGGLGTGAPASLRLTLFRQLVDVCDRFETDWRAGRAPRIEDHLLQVSESQRRAGLRELLALELELRASRGEHPTPRDYGDRFPEFPDVVAAAFAEAAAGSGTDLEATKVDSGLERGSVGETFDQPTEPGSPGSEFPRAASGRAGLGTDSRVLVSGYEIEAELGRGGMGVVYKAHQHRLNRTCALKMILTGDLAGPEAIVRFLLEAEMVARLRHPNIVQIYAIGDHNGRPYLDLEYVEGGSLASQLDGTPRPPREAAELVEALARGIAEAHHMGIVHRDLKPGNVLLAADGTPKITDFGLAKFLGADSGLTRSDSVLGSPSYMSPEQAEGRLKDVGPTADQYALGAILYELLTGRPPFRAATVLETLAQVKAADPVPPGRLQPGLPHDVETITLKCLEKDPARRYATALELADDLQRFREGSPIRARRVGPGERAWKWIKRHPAPAALGTVSVVTLLTLAGMVQARRSSAAAERSYLQAREAIDALTQFGERRLGDQPKLRKELLEIALHYYARSLGEGDGGPVPDEELANTYARVARLIDLVGTRAEALRAFEKALQAQRKLAADPAPAEDLAQRQADLAETLHSIGVIQNDMGRRSEAIASYREALAIRRRLVREFPEDRAFWSDLARSQGYIGDWELDGARYPEARAAYDEALEIRERLAEADPSDLVAEFQRARSYNNSGRLVYERGDPRRARAWLAKAAALQTRLVAIGPDEARRRLEANPRSFDLTFADFQSDLAYSHAWLGYVSADLGETDRALAEFEQAQTLYENLVRDHPEVSYYAGELAWAQTYLGLQRNSKEDLAAAGQRFGLLVHDYPGVLRLRDGLAFNRAAAGELARRAGDPTDARALLDEALALQQHLAEDPSATAEVRRHLRWTREALARLTSPSPGPAQTP